SAQLYKVTTENYHKAADQLSARFKRYEAYPVCTDLQSQILQCYVTTPEDPAVLRQSLRNTWKQVEDRGLEEEQEAEPEPVGWNREERGGDAPPDPRPVELERTAAVQLSPTPNTPDLTRNGTGTTRTDPETRSVAHPPQEDREMKTPSPPTADSPVPPPSPSPLPPLP
ncbi:hypothetical protein CRUP_033565, partial [Coryphaenoides rupestris]